MKTFEPYDRVKEENSEARTAAKALIEEGKTAGKAKVKSATGARGHSFALRAS